MDFASLMKAEITKKSAQLETKNIVTAEKKSFKRSELYKRGYNGVNFVENHTAAKRARDNSNMVFGIDKDLIPMTVNVADNDIAKSILDSEQVSKKVRGVTKGKRRKGSGKDADGNLVEENMLVPPHIVKKRLRERREPVKIFGETDEETYIRFRRFELQALGAARFADSWLRNDFKYSKSRQKKEEIEALLNREYNKIKNEEIDRKTDPTRTTEKNFKYDIKLRNFEEWLIPYIPLTLADFETKNQAALAALLPRATELKKGTRQHEMDTILYTFRFLQISWGMELNLKRTFLQKKSVNGRGQTAIYKSTEEMLDPLFTMLRQHNLPADMAVHISEMVYCMIVDRNYVKATDAYMCLAIGNSPWPLGITMTQIHVRPGHEKIKAKNIAHVFNDEVQRRFIQASKRLMTFAQRVWPCDPSKCVEFNGARPEYDLLAASSVDQMTAPVVFDTAI